MRPIASLADKVIGRSVRLTGNVTNSTNVAANVTGMALTMAANEVWIFDFFIFIGNDNTGGTKFALTAPAGATFKAEAFGMNSGSTAFRADSMSVSGTLTSVYYTIASTGGFVRITGTVVCGATSGNLQLQFASGVDTQTSTVFANSHLRATKL